ncbi:interleukin-1 receptor-like 1 [Nerophis lumbriciformis]|uniref:interleukin-1 receptor-like 1 n=1 Tax=Nerophis lumbriciformis TaxID=546530 RepID=UPI002AE0A52B|nr:interleukin-1 receptor type 2-like [Nerophis lumbriciformis]
MAALSAAWLRVLAALVFVALTHSHQAAPDTFQASAGRLLLLRCPLTGAHSNVTWTRGGTGGGTLPPGVEVREGLLWFLPVRTSHNGTYTCEARRDRPGQLVYFGVLVSPDLCPPAAEVRSMDLGVSESLPCQQDDILGLNRTHNLRWLKDCHPVERQGTPVAVHASGSMRLTGATQEDAGKYTCLVEVRLHGSTYTSARSIQLEINNVSLFTDPEVFLQQDVVAVELGARVELKCHALMGFQVDQETFLYWLVHGTYAEDDEELQESVHSSRSRGRVVLTSTLTIAKVVPRFLNTNFSCRLKHPRRNKDRLLLLVEASPSRSYTAVCIGAVASLLFFFLLAAVLLFFKVDVTLACRRLRGRFSRQRGDVTSPGAGVRRSACRRRRLLSSDVYDAFVSVLHDGRPTSAHAVAAAFALRTLPGQLEERHGYRLFIAGRDDTLGEARHDAMADVLCRCRRLIIILSRGGTQTERKTETQTETETERMTEMERKTETQTERKTEMQTETERKTETQTEMERKMETETEKKTERKTERRAHLSYEQKLGLHDALTGKHPRVILVEIDGPLDYGDLPESLGYIRRRQGALTWRTDGQSNRIFWKKLRYHMPSLPQGGQPSL